MQPHHGEIQTLTDSENIGVLREEDHAHLACHVKDDLYVVPITYAFEDGHIYSHSQEGKKIEMMRQNPNVCIQVEQIQDFFHWKSVIVWGKFEELKGNESSSAMRWYAKKLAERGNWRVSSLQLDMSAILESAVMFKIKVQKATGRYESK